MAHAKPQRKAYRKKGRCERCDIHRSLALMTVDHIVPQCLLKAYPRIRNHAANKQTLCEDCNNSKGSGVAVDYRDDPEKRRTLLRLLAQERLNIEVYTGTKVAA